MKANNPSPFSLPLSLSFLSLCLHFPFLTMRKCGSMGMDVLDGGEGIQREYSPASTEYVLMGFRVLPEGTQSNIRNRIRWTTIPLTFLLLPTINRKIPTAMDDPQSLSVYFYSVCLPLCMTDRNLPILITYFIPTASLVCFKALLQCNQNNENSLTHIP